MKMIKIKHIAIILAVLGFATACKKDESGPEVSPFVGTFTISEATLSETLIMSVTANGINIDYPLAAGSDITEMIQTSLLSAVACTDESNSRIELKEDNTLFIKCEGEGKELNAGTWEEASATTLTLNMNSAAIPTSPTGVVLSVTDLAWAGNLLSGITSIPLPREMLGAIAEQYGATLNVDVTPAVVNASVAIEFTKQ